MFRNVPACSGMFRVPGFIDASTFGPPSWDILYDFESESVKNKGV